MATVILSRNPGQPSPSNTLNPNGTQFQFYEKTYTTTGAQDWITIPDRDGVSVTLSFSASTGSIECTDSPPDVITGGSPVAVTWAPGVVGATTTQSLIGFTAFRVNVATGASVKLSAAV